MSKKRKVKEERGIKNKSKKSEREREREGRRRFDVADGGGGGGATNSRSRSKPLVHHRWLSFAYEIQLSTLGRPPTASTPPPRPWPPAGVPWSAPSVFYSTPSVHPATSSEADRGAKDLAWTARALIGVRGVVDVPPLPLPPFHRIFFFGRLFHFQRRRLMRRIRTVQCSFGHVSLCPYCT